MRVPLLPLKLDGRCVATVELSMLPISLIEPNETLKPC